MVTSASAHGTNPASAALAGMKVVIVECDSHGNVNLEDLGTKAARHSEDLACIMVTYPSTHGVFEKHASPLLTYRTIMSQCSSVIRLL